MGQFRGGSTVSGYPVLHSGLKNAYLDGNLNLSNGSTFKTTYISLQNLDLNVGYAGSEFYITKNGKKVWDEESFNPSTKLNSSGDKINGTLTIGSGVLNNNSTRSYDKVRVWNNSFYTIGMRSGLSYGYLGGDHAMTFTMDGAMDRGFLWRDNGHSTSDGAMSLTLDGRLYLKDKADVGSLNSRGSISESGSALSSRYLGKTAKAVDSDKLDGYHGSQFVRSDTSDTMDGSLTLSNGGGGTAQIVLDISNSGSPQISISDTDNDNFWAIGADDSDNNFSVHGSTSSMPTISSISNPHFEITTGGVLKASGSTIWHAGNFNPSDKISADGGNITGVINLRPSAGGGTSYGFISANGDIYVVGDGSFDRGLSTLGNLDMTNGSKITVGSNEVVHFYSENNGQSMMIGGGAATILAAGESGEIAKSNVGDSEHLYLVSDNDIILRSNLNSGNWSDGNQMTYTAGGDLIIPGNLRTGGWDLRLGEQETSRGDTGSSRALVKDSNGTLVINYVTDFYGGTRVDGGLHVNTNWDTSATDMDGLVVGTAGGNRVSIDDNEVSSFNGTSVGQLNLNNDGGDVRINGSGGPGSGGLAIGTTVSNSSVALQMLAQDSNGQNTNTLRIEKKSTANDYEWRMAFETGATRWFNFDAVSGGTMRLRVNGSHVYDDRYGADKVSSEGYSRSATGSSWYAVWMNSARQFMRNTSSIRYKENVRSWDCGDAVLNLRPVIFDRKGEETPNGEVGFIAEEVFEHIPESIQYFEGEIDGIYERPLITGIVVLCQKQQKEIDSQKENMESLLKRIEYLEKQT
jgi:hypothetical protein